MILRRIQQLRISLAAKCQLLFGAAVVLIIAAALFVPWQRIEQLTEQLNERTAAALSDQAVATHVATARAAASASANQRALAQRALADAMAEGGGKAASPATPGGGSSTRPAAAAGQRPGDGELAAQPRLVRLWPRRDNADLSKFEGRAANHFIQEPDDKSYSFYYDRRDGGKGYRYARPVHLVALCTACHVAVALPPASQSGGIGPVVGGATRPATLPVVARTTTDALVAGGMVPLPADRDPSAAAGDGKAGADPSAGDAAPPLVGVVSVDFASRIDAKQLLLNRFFILTAGAIAGVLAIVTFYFITTRLILQPVRVLQETADKVSRGDLNIRSDISTGDEFQQLSETFNVMLTNLKGSSDQLKAMNKSLDLKLGQLAESNVSLYESNRLKSEFLANVSHELRTPLNSILGFADLLKDGMPPPPPTPDGKPATTGPEVRSARYVGNILTSGRQLLELINDLLDLAKIEAGKMEVRSEPLSVPDMFEGLANLLRPLLEQKKLTLAVTVAADVPILQADPVKLQQVLYNFLSNAIKFSPVGSGIDLKATYEADDEPANAPPPDGLDARAAANGAAVLAAAGPGGGASPAHAAVAAPPPMSTPRLARPGPPRSADAAAAADEPHVRISVTHRGPGIAADQQNVIFEKFRQIDGSVTRTHGGSGLGLAISKELTLLMGGSIGVKSKAGEGASFWLLLPLKVTPGTRDVRSRVAMA